MARLALLGAPAIVVYLIWKWRTFGTLIPNTLSAKAEPLAGVLLSIGFFSLVFPLLTWWAMRMAWGVTLLAERQVMTVAIGFLIAALGVRPQVGHAYRFFLPVLAPMLALAGLYLMDLAERHRSGTDDPRWRFGAFGLVLAYAMIPVYTLSVYADNEAQGLKRAHMDLGQTLARKYRPTDVLAASDCGIIPYLSRMKTIDIWGLTDRRIATQGFSSSYVLAQRPDVIVLHSYFPDQFKGRESYDQLLHDAIAGDASWRVAGRWETYGYWLWMYARRPPKPAP